MVVGPDYVYQQKIILLNVVSTKKINKNPKKCPILAHSRAFFKKIRLLWPSIGLFTV
jgi:hypothetical protein